MQKGVKFRIYPNKEQQTIINPTEQSIKAIIFALLGNISNFLSWDMSKSANQWK